MAKARGPFRKPKPDVYTVMLAVSLVAIIIACVLLYLETADYPESPPWSGGPSVQATDLFTPGGGQFDLGLKVLGEISAQKN